MFIAPIQRMEFSGSNESLVKSENGSSIPFSGILKDAVQNLQETQKATEADSYNLAMGNMDDLAGMMIRSSKHEAALNMTVQLTTRMVNTYKDIMQMQV